MSIDIFCPITCWISADIFAKLYGISIGSHLKCNVFLTLLSLLNITVKSVLSANLLYWMILKIYLKIMTNNGLRFADKYSSHNTYITLIIVFYTKVNLPEDWFTECMSEFYLITQAASKKVFQHPANDRGFPPGTAPIK